MAAIINALDKQYSLKRGENGHFEYGWSSNVPDIILQFSFQLTRTNEKKMKDLSLTLNDLLFGLKTTLFDNTKTIYEKEVARGQLCILYKMIGYTRDIIDGKGEYTLSYMMIHTWFNYFPALALFAIKCLVIHSTKEHQYGSWKDIKLFCEYCKKQDNNDSSILIKYSISLLNQQLAVDYANYISNSDDISLAAKWAPREKSAHGWLFNMLAADYFSSFLETAKDQPSYNRALLKCKTEYRKILSGLNRKIDTLQIKQCGKIWRTIDFNHVPSIALLKQRKAFLNMKINGDVKYPDDEDRICCAKNFTSFIRDNTKEIKGKRISMADFTKQALNILNHQGEHSQIEYDLLNSQWRDSSSVSTKMGKMIAMVDVSDSMSGDPMYAAIALGIRIAENSLLGNRIMTFHNKPKWINLDGQPDFISKVKVVKNADWGTNTNFYAALDMILNAIIETKMSAEDVQDMVLVILSDMQMDMCDNCDKNALYNVMNNKYEAAGMRLHGVPFKPPHILFWNLRSTSGFPCLADQRNTTMMSGFSPAILNLFCEEGITSLQSCTPWSTLQKSLENERYQIMSNKLYEVLQL